ncbi:MAG: hypothetical protein U9Q82_06445 [Chloroflexota bacterium]|nr:hypothetical protein [Chloroflexota bacterium]
MTKRRMLKLVNAGNYAAKVEVELIYTDDDWSPYLSVKDAAKLDDVRQALQKEDIQRASQRGSVYRLQPVAA